MDRNSSSHLSNFSAHLKLFPNVLSLNNAHCGLRGDMGCRRGPKKPCQVYVPLFVGQWCRLTIMQKVYISHLSLSFWQVLHPRLTPQPRLSVWLLPLTHVYYIQYFIENCMKALFYNRTRWGECRWAREAATYTGKKMLREAKEKMPTL